MISEIATTTEHYKKLVEILGSDYLKETVESPFDFIQIASRGVAATGNPVG